MDSLAPNIFVRDINNTIEFYKQLGFTLTMTIPEEGDIVWAMMKNDQVTFMFQTFDSLGNDLPQINRTAGGSLLFYIHVKNIRELHSRLQNKVTLLTQLEKTFYGATEFSILDNNNYILTFAQDE